MPDHSNVNHQSDSKNFTLNQSGNDSKTGLQVTDFSVKEKVVSSNYLPNLQGVRASAAIVVVISHIELHKGEKLAHLIPPSIYLGIGQLGVTIFFVLSGFLLTYLLLSEKEKKGIVKLQDFYIRRILRIFPLFYLVLFLGYFVMPNFYEENPQSLSIQSFLLNAFFLTNVAFIKDLTPVGVSQLWSIGVEE
ncbi:MAG: acyltransferase, partial [Verrucomicrobia bacterium]|nr:acyltransferase [Cytophagales bacterium]